jgi:Cytochrome P460
MSADGPWEDTLKLVAIVWLLVVPGSTIGWQVSGGDAQVAYPDAYRTWVHVKSELVSPAHQSSATNGGFHHVYANPEAMTGYRSRSFPEGSVVVFDWLEMKDNNGVFAEGARRQIDVMVKDSTRFAKTGGWGFQRFVKTAVLRVS